ncbi:MAG: signal transduction histidine kinase/ligand-binding sensor domain-containing protein [Phenylobacterium sp.]|jgi:signal transduction histidine kinase/ligand-binding sensor domain-containing protein
MRLLITLFVLFYSIMVQAAGPALHFDRFSLDDGLSQAAVSDIFQDRDGFLWFATQDGLNRYDGYTFKVFRHDPQDQYSISNNTIRTLFEDSKGRLWIGTNGGGLNRYDALTERFVHFSHDASDPTSLSSNDVRSIAEDAQGNLWVGTFGGGLNRFDGESAIFEHFRHNDSDPDSVSHDRILSLHRDSKGTLWVGTSGGLDYLKVDRLEGESKSQSAVFGHYRHDPQDPSSLSHRAVLVIYEDSAGSLWLGTPVGLNRFDANTESFSRFQHQASDSKSLSHNFVRSIYEDNSETLWVGTWGGGLSKLAKSQQKLGNSGNFTHFQHDPVDSHSLSNNYVLSILQDSRGILWFGTSGGGINKVDTQKQLFGHFKQQVSDPHSLSGNSVVAIHKDSKGALWVGADNSGLNKYDEVSQAFTHFRYDSTDPNSLSHDTVVAIYEDNQARLWIGTDGGGLDLYQSGEFSHFSHEATDPDSLSHNEINVILQDSKGTLWIGTDGSGLDKMIGEGRFKHYQHDDSNATSLSNGVVNTIFEDSTGSLWIGTYGGLNKFDRQTEQFMAYQHQPSNPQSLSHNTVFSIHEDSKGILWIGTFGGGLNKFDKTTGHFTHYRKKDGLANENIYGILEDNQGLLWLSTNQGLSQFDSQSELFKNYDSNDGLQSNEFNGAYFKADDGELFFGGINGFNRFYPKNIKSDDQVPTVVLTDFLLANQSVPVKTDASGNLGMYTGTRNGISDNRNFSLPKVIDALTQLTLTHQQNLISFEFAALHFANPMKNQYAYQLDGWSKAWIFTDANNRRATYTNLPAGAYTLRVKASNKDGYWNEQSKSLKIVILPPPWKTWWAYLIYLALTGALILAFTRTWRQKLLAQRQKAQSEHTLIMRLQQVDKLKDEFLANTSHELRTPLNGIIGLAESLIDGIAGPQSKSGIANLAMIVSSGKRLSNLVNDILDFSKLKNANLTITPGSVDLYQMVEVVLTLSRPLLGAKKLELVNAIPADFPAAEADENRLTQILHNLVSNAIKFTDSGKVTVSAVEQNNRLTVRVSDTGIGITKDNFATIFDSFEQLDGDTVRAHSGTGLGLSISKQLVELHGGQLRVESELGQGSTFSFSLAVGAQKPTADVANQSIISRLHTFDDNEHLPAALPVAQADGDRFRLLLVDDEPINRQVLRNHLSRQNYELVEASGGTEALRAIKEKGPFDLVLLDIMMPGVSGYEVCSRLRDSYPASELPVIFLTAKNQVADMVHSFAVGANDYLSKPVSKHELLTRVETHLKFLDIHRNLEGKVAERTQELMQKNDEVKQKNQQVQQQNSEIIATQQQLIQSEKMASLGILTAGVAHEINNPTNFVHVSTQNLEVDLVRFQQFLFALAGEDADVEVLNSFRAQFAPLHEHLTIIKSGTERIKLIVQDLRAFTQLDAAAQKTVKITDLLQSTLNLVQTKYLEVAEFVTDFTITPELLCYPAQLNQVFMNLIINACDAIESNQQQQGSSAQGRIVIGCHQQGEAIVIVVRDNGCGMSKESKNNLFEPFYTTKDVGKGTGLGLSISFGIVQKHGGELTVESEPGQGATFRLVLPT